MCFKAWVLRTTKEDFLDTSQGNCLRIVLGTRLTDFISNTRLYKKCGSIPPSMAIMKVRLNWLGYTLLMKNDRLSKIVFFGQTSRAKRKAGRPRLGLEDVLRKALEK